MKLLKTVLLFGGLLTFAMTLCAETALVNVNVPFAFVAGGKMLPAGQYTIGEADSGGFLLIHGNQPNSTALVLAVNAGESTNKHPGVTFSRRGGSVVLSTVEIPGGVSYSLAAPEHRTPAAMSVALPGK